MNNDDKEIGGQQFADRAQQQAKSRENSPKAASAKKNKFDLTDKSFSINAEPMIDNFHEKQNVANTPSKHQSPSSKNNMMNKDITATPPKPTAKKESRQMLMAKLNN